MNILKKFWRSITTRFIPQMLCTSVKNKIKTFVERFERKPLNLDFNMENYFSLENRIKENRQYLREIQDKYVKIRNYYPLFFIYIGFMSVYTFDILQYFLSNEITSSMFVLGTLLIGHITLFAYVFYLFTQILILKDVAVDLSPEKIFSKKNDNNSEAVLSGYCERLEIDVKNNYSILREKKLLLARVIKYSIISFIVYIVLITSYKIDTMKINEDEEPKKEKVEFEAEYLKDHEEKNGDLISDSLPAEKDSLNETDEHIKKILHKSNYIMGNK